MEGIYQNSLYSSSSSQQPSYVLPMNQQQQQSDHYGNAHPYRSSAFSGSRTPSYTTTAATHSLSSYQGLNHNNNNTVNMYSAFGNRHPYNNSTSMNWATPWNNNSTISSLPPPNRHYLGYPSAFNSNGTSHFVSGTTPMQRSKLTTTVWEDEGTICYQVDAKSICVARRQDNDMINGTKLLNVVGMSRGKRDGILKNEKGRVVVKVGAMHLKGVWITFSRAKDLATKFKIVDILYPLFVEDPSVFLATSSSSSSAIISNTNNNNFMLNSSTHNNNNSHILPLMLSPSIKNNNNGFSSSFNMSTYWDHNKCQPLPSISITNRQQNNHEHNIIMRYQQSATTNTADTAAAAATITTAATTNTADADADADAAAAAATTTTTIATTTAITTTTATTNNNNNNNNNNSHNNNNNNSPVPGSIDNGENDIYFTSYNYRSSFNNRNQLYTSDTLNTSYDPKQEEATTEEIINNNEDLHTKNSNPSIEGSLKYNFISNESSTENPWTDDSNKSSLSIELSSNFEENIKSLSRDRKRSSHYQLQQRERKRIKDGE